MGRGVWWLLWISYRKLTGRHCIVHTHTHIHTYIYVYIYTTRKIVSDGRSCAHRDMSAHSTKLVRFDNKLLSICGFAIAGRSVEISAIEPRRCFRASAVLTLWPSMTADGVQKGHMQHLTRNQIPPLPVQVIPVFDLNQNEKSPKGVNELSNDLIRGFSST